jgi:hypothetical protein
MPHPTTTFKIQTDPLPAGDVWTWVAIDPETKLIPAWYIGDPPYSKEHCKKYGTPNYPLKKSMAEFRRVLAPGGYLGLLHFY